jgi:hypothetical protein
VRDLPFIRSVYSEIDAQFEAARIEATGRRDLHAVDRIERKQRVNDQAYFVLCWGQLETAIDEKCRSAIRARRRSDNWAVRRGWDIYNPEEGRLSGLRFEERTALVLDRSAGAGSSWAKVMSHYSLRNQIAHGALLAQRIDLDAVAQEFFQIQGELKD